MFIVDNSPLPSNQSELTFFYFNFHEVCNSCLLHISLWLIYKFPPKNCRQSWYSKAGINCMLLVGCEFDIIIQG